MADSPLYGSESGHGVPSRGPIPSLRRHEPLSGREVSRSSPAPAWWCPPGGAEHGPVEDVMLGRGGQGAAAFAASGVIKATKFREQRTRSVVS
ncbi:hypothetical protein GCM10010094_24310 [Streptomyces flaveus]|uniref:Uncharacterized protein n=1 Tax=Streptomyces flaveus TaxID=66370 RepID=A0A917QPN5_9ACTN|nr:hypothetical protein GCM10010094_24310 [Streptomyces flaveus]